MTEFICPMNRIALPGVPIFLPNFKFNANWRRFAGEVQGFARDLGGLKTGIYGEIAVVWGDPDAPCYRVQSADSGVGLRLAEGPYTNENCPGYDILYGVRCCYVAMGFNHALFANHADPGAQRELVRLRLGDLANWPGVKQIIVDPEIISDNGGEITPYRNPIYSRNKTPGKNFAPSLIAVDSEVCPTWGTAFTVDA